MHQDNDVLVEVEKEPFAEQFDFRGKPLSDFDSVLVYCVLTKVDTEMFIEAFEELID